jgi:hypothetical protein
LKEQILFGDAAVAESTVILRTKRTGIAQTTFASLSMHLDSCYTVVGVQKKQMCTIMYSIFNTVPVLETTHHQESVSSPVY